MHNQTNNPSVMASKKNRMSPSHFKQILHENHNLAQLLEDYPEHPEQYVRSFMLRINGKHRKIITYQSDEFGRDLREIHRLLAYAVRSIYTSSANSFAYKEDVGVLSVLEKHLSSDVFLKTDIHAYFDSVNFDTMLNCLLSKQKTMQKQKAFWTKALAVCFYEGHLPIGFVSSPILSDLYLNDLDHQFSAIEDVQYTRYADDIIFSSNAEGAEEKLREVQENLTNCLVGIHLEPNRKKTYIRTLKQQGDAIHLLGLNLVKTTEAKNRITVSDRYIRKTSMEFSELIQEKDQIEEWERQERFSQISGKIGYIRHVSPESTEKLRKMIRIKTGIVTDLTYKSLSNLCLSDVVPNIITKHSLPKIEYSSPQMRDIPRNGRIREEVHLPPESDFRIVAALRYYLYHLCMDAASETSDIRISKAVLTIRGDTKEINNVKDIPSFRDHVLRLRKNREEIFYTAEYHYQDDVPIFTMNRIPAHGIIYDEGGTNYTLFGPIKATRTDLNNQQAISRLIDDMIPSQNDWQGIFRMDLRWPRSTDSLREEQIQKLCVSITKTPGINEEEIDFSRRHFVCASEKHLTGQSLQSLFHQLVELNKVLCEVNGRNKMHGIFKPAASLVPTKLSDFWYIEMNQRVTGSMEIICLSFD